MPLFIIIFKFTKYHYILELNNQYKQLETKRKKFCFQLLILYSDILKETFIICYTFEIYVVINK